ncbi:MAG: hypothetical protein LC799_30830, partial [Actinobacteria bacterium]|nr:hypothetical protein [Actinomycetota bacterium]
MEPVEVWKGRHGDPVPPFGPLPGVRLNDTLAYEFEVPARLVAWPGRTLLNRVFVLLDLGVSMSLPAWRPTRGVDRDKSEPDTWKSFGKADSSDVAVGTALTGGPPHRS